MAKEMKALNGYEIVDQTARDKIDKLPKGDNRNLLLYTKDLVQAANNEYDLSTISGIDLGFARRKATLTDSNISTGGFYNYFYYGNIGDIILGETYTLYFRARGTIKHAVVYFYGPDGYLQCEKNWNDTDGYASTNPDGRIVIDVSESWKNYMIHFKLKDSGQAFKGKHLCCRSDNSSAGWFEFYPPKLQIGEKITAWSPAPTDVLSAILSGSNVPDSSYGRNGDFYIMY